MGEVHNDQEQDDTDHLETNSEAVNPSDDQARGSYANLEGTRSFLF